MESCVDARDTLTTLPLISHAPLLFSSCRNRGICTADARQCCRRNWGQEWLKTRLASLPKLCEAFSCITIELVPAAVSFRWRRHLLQLMAWSRLELQVRVEQRSLQGSFRGIHPHSEVVVLNNTNEQIMAGCVWQSKHRQSRYS